MIFTLFSETDGIFSMETTFQMLLIVCPLVFLAAALDAIGGGGGLISLPAYYLAGLPAAMAGGSNKLSACIGTLISTFKYFKEGKIHLVPALCAVAGALPGAWFGAQLLQLVDEHIIRLCLLIGFPLIAVLMLVKRDTPVQPKPITRARLAGCFALGLGCGLYDGFFGPGTGTLLIMGLTYLIGLDMISASGTAKLINLASNLSALTVLTGGQNVLFSLALPAALFSVAGGYLGSWLAIRKGAPLIRKTLLAVLVMLMIKLAIDWLGA